MRSSVRSDPMGIAPTRSWSCATGLHYFRWEGTGAVTAAEESTFNAVTSFGGVA